MWKHPKYYKELRKRAREQTASWYKELRKRNNSDQVISETKPTGDGERAPGPGLKHQASSDKQQASSESKPEPSSGSEASSDKL